jgi:hypothetical protein
MPGKTGPIERRLRAVYSQVASWTLTRVLRPSRAEDSWSVLWWVTAGCPWAGDSRLSECHREDWCRWVKALLPSGQSDDGVRPVPSSSLRSVCVVAPARLSLRFAHASGRPVSLTRDVRHARNSGEFWKDHNLGRLAHRVEVHNEEHQRCLCERAHLVREDS